MVEAWGGEDGVTQRWWRMGWGGWGNTEEGGDGGGWGGMDGDVAKGGGGGLGGWESMPFGGGDVEQAGRGMSERGRRGMSGGQSMNKRCSFQFEGSRNSTDPADYKTALIDGVNKAFSGKRMGSEEIQKFEDGYDDMVVLLGKDRFNRVKNGEHIRNNSK